MQITIFSPGDDGYPGMGNFDLDVVSAPSLARVRIQGAKLDDAERLVRQLAREVDTRLPALRTIEMASCHAALDNYNGGEVSAQEVAAAVARLQGARGVEGAWLIHADPADHPTLTAQRIIFE